MAFSYVSYTGDGVTTLYTINFTLGFLSKDDVHCYVDGIEVTFSWVTDGIIQLDSAPASGTTILIRRIVDKSSLIHDYTDGAIVVEQNLDDSNKQTLMAAHEFLDGFIEQDGGFFNDISMNNFRITNLGTAIDDHDAVNYFTLRDFVAKTISDEGAYSAFFSEEFTATADQTAFTLSSTNLSSVLHLAVFIDGVFQSPSNYTTDSVSTVIFSEPIEENSEVTIEWFMPFSLDATENNKIAAQAAADAAELSATTAAASEASATASADAAALSESNTAADAASTAADALATASDAATVASLYDSFDDRYLGAKAVDPTVDNDGNALLVGALYFNTVINSMKVYDGALWNIAYTSVDYPLQVIPTVGGGTLTIGYYVNELQDSSTYTLPLASSVDAGESVQVEITDKYSASTPIVTATGADTITDVDGSDTSVLFNSLSSISVRFISDGISDWRI